MNFLIPLQAVPPQRRRSLRRHRRHWDARRRRWLEGARRRRRTTLLLLLLFVVLLLRLRAGPPASPLPATRQGALRRTRPTHAPPAGRGCPSDCLGHCVRRCCRCYVVLDHGRGATFGPQWIATAHAPAPREHLGAPHDPPRRPRAGADRVLSEDLHGVRVRPGGASPGLARGGRRAAPHLPHVLARLGQRAVRCSVAAASPPPPSPIRRFVVVVVVPRQWRQQHGRPR